MSWNEPGLTVELGTGDVGWRRTVMYMAWVLVMAFFFANAEIQIEGGAGWATSLPTWRIEHHWLLDIFWGGRAMTGSRCAGSSLSGSSKTSCGSSSIRHGAGRSSSRSW
jgi:hypothetical protein